MPTLAVMQALQSALMHQQAGRLAEAEPLYRQVLQEDPTNADALHRLGFLYHQTGRSLEGLELIRKSIAANPSAAHFYNNLGEVLKALGQWDEALAAYRKALSVKPYDPIALNNLGTVLVLKKELREAIECFQKAVNLKPGYANAWSNLGNALSESDRPAEASVALRKAIALAPNVPTTYNNLAIVYKHENRIDDVIECCRKAVALQPNFGEAWNNLGSFLKDQGRVVDAAACLRRAAELQPRDSQAHSNYLLLAQFDPANTPESFLQAHRNWAQRHAESLYPTSPPAYPNDRSPTRRLKIGYVSPNFRQHALGRFFEPVFLRHDHAAFEIILYSDTKKQDEFTARFRQGADTFLDTQSLSDAQLADQIRRDQIDVLIDLTAHMAENRMPVFARKPAPVQATWLAYPATTGLATMDYLITDPYLDPPDLFEYHHVEKLYRLPHSYWCYNPSPDGPEVNALPADTQGHITFGSLNNFCKNNPQVLALYARVLQAVPQSRLALLIKGGVAGNASVLRDLANYRIAPERVTFYAQCPQNDFLKLHHHIDIGLDPFPYNGHTTSMDALWMGVPFVTLAGRTAAGRAGVGLLTNVGLPELIAKSPDEYVALAARLAQDLPRLRELRANLRPMMERSPLLAADAFTRDLETAYRTMWATWCGTGVSPVSHNQ